jgi:hypothetical protein
MSKIALQGDASGTGTFTIASPNSNTDRTLTLPDEAGTVLTSASTLSSSNLSGALPALDGSALTGISGGQIVNIATSEQTSAFETSSSTFQDVTGLSLSYTMQDSNNKIIFTVLGSIQRGSQNGGIGSSLNFDGSDIFESRVEDPACADNTYLPYGSAVVDGYSGAKTFKAVIRSTPNNAKCVSRTGSTLMVMEYTP